VIGWRQLAIVMLATLGATAFAPAASASAAKPKRIPHATSVVGDGVRYAAYQKRPGTLTIIDTEAGKSKDLGVDAGCGLVSASRGRALLLCRAEDGSEYPLVLDLRTRAIVRPTGVEWSDRYDNVGRYWLDGATEIHPGDLIPVFLNWRTGERVEGDGGLQRNLDSPGLAPLAPCGRRWSSTVRFASPFVLLLDSKGLRLTKCHSTKLVVVSTCPVGCGLAQLSPDWITWSAGARAFAYSTRTGRGFKWRFSGLDPSFQLGVSHTRTRLFVNVTRSGSAPGTYEETDYQVALRVAIAD
jgi:hypothetical protein